MSGFQKLMPHLISVRHTQITLIRAGLFSDFKADNSNRLKLLYCIDMLNEGIHLDDIYGVILLLPTVSSIIYKQQIGRALSENKTNNLVIFDIVLNIENVLTSSWDLMYECEKNITKKPHTPVHINGREYYFEDGR